MLPPFTMRAGADGAVLDVTGDNARRRPLVIAGIDEPLRIEQIKAWFRAQHVEVGGVKGVNGADIAPVGMFFVVRDAGDAVVGEVVGKHPMAMDQARQDIAAKIVFAAFMRFTQCLQQDIGVKQIVAHGSVGAARVGRAWVVDFSVFPGIL